jgi:hypothetical protein
VRLPYLPHMGLLHPTPLDRMVDGRGRPYFLWDVDMTLQDFERRLRDGDAPTRGYLVGKLMRQARPDDVFTFVTRDEIETLWPELERYLGRTRAFWRWWLDYWRSRDGDRTAD